MRTSVVTVAAGETVLVAWELLERTRARHLPVVRSDGRCAGVLDRAEVAVACAAPAVALSRRYAGDLLRSRRCAVVHQDDPVGRGGGRDGRPTAARCCRSSRTRGGSSGCWARRTSCPALAARPARQGAGGAVPVPGDAGPAAAPRRGAGLARSVGRGSVDGVTEGEARTTMCAGGTAPKDRGREASPGGAAPPAGRLPAHGATGSRSRRSCRRAAWGPAAEGAAGAHHPCARAVRLTGRYAVRGRVPRRRGHRTPRGRPPGQTVNGRWARKAAEGRPDTYRFGLWFGGMCPRIARWKARCPPRKAPPSQTFSRVPVNRPLRRPSAASWLSWHAESRTASASNRPSRPPGRPPAAASAIQLALQPLVEGAVAPVQRALERGRHQPGRGCGLGPVGGAELVPQRLGGEHVRHFDGGAAVAAVQEDEEPRSFGEAGELTLQFVVEVLAVVEDERLVEGVGLLVATGLVGDLPAVTGVRERKASPSRSRPPRRGGRR